MRRTIKPIRLTENAWNTAYPSPTEYRVDVSTLNGGLNLWDLSYNLSVNQSPDCVNVYWKDGCLSSRKGQAYLSDSTSYGAFIDCYSSLWQDYIIAHKGTNIYKIDPSTGAHTALLPAGITITATKGAGFFVFGAKLYYLGGGKYLEITTGFVISEVVPFVPLTVVNRQPDGTGGSTYQKENRIARGKRVQFTSDGSTTKYVLPYSGLTSDGLVVKVLNINVSPMVWVTYTEVPDVTSASGNVYQVDRTNGYVTFKTAPAQASTAILNTVDITCYVGGTEQQEQIDSIMSCTCSCVFGGSTDLVVVLGGNTAQPNAYYWSGNTDVDLDPSYFPYISYNYAGSESLQKITGFGRQQDLLVIFSERHIGKNEVTTITIDDVDYIELNYTPINNAIGCDLQGTVQLIQNNLVFANSYGGVYVLADTTLANENNVKRISRNVNGDASERGLFYDLRSAVTNSQRLSSFDDQQRYWLIANGHAYLWDYTISSYASKEEKLSWFYFENIGACGWVNTTADSYYFKSDGKIVEFIDDFADFGNTIERKYAFSAHYFGTYETLKDVTKVVFSVRSDTDSAMTITYKTDYETRTDLTPIRAWSWRLAPRNLSHRSLRPIVFSMSAVRVPRCFHIRHFQMILTNSTIYSDMSIVSAQIFYRYSREDR